MALLDEIKPLRWSTSVKETNSLGEYKCSKCLEWKDPSQFNKNKNQVSGLSYACKICTKTQSRKYNLPSKYGITVETFNEMLESQNNECACCGIEFKKDAKHLDRPCVDHNHRTKKVRDIICGRCNLAAGNVSDSSVRAEQLFLYLKKWNC